MTRRAVPSGLVEQWEAVVAQMPPTVRGAISTELWDREALWALPLPTIMWPVQDLAWLFDVPLWAVDGRPFQVSPNQVRRDPACYAAQYARAMRSDLAFPIHVVQLHGRWTILDGVHRLLKADLSGRREIASKPLSEQAFTSICYR